MGQLPGPRWRISGCIGQVYSADSLAADDAGLVLAESDFATGPGAGPRTIRDGPEGTGRGARYFSGAVRNFCAHPSQQKKYVRPPNSARARALFGSTCIPQTGSRSIALGPSVITDHASRADHPLAYPTYPETPRASFEVAAAALRYGCYTLLMTLVEVTYDLQTQLRPEQLRALGAFANTYGLRRFRVDEQRNQISLEYDASRLTETEVAHVLGLARIPVQRRV